MDKQMAACDTLLELNEVELLSTEGGVIFEAIALGMGITYGLLEAYQWGYDYAKARM
jgi:hypothetical protein